MTFTEGERVWCYDFDGSKVQGSIHRNTDHPDVSDWYIKYDDGHECAVLDENSVNKVKN